MDEIVNLSEEREKRTGPGWPPLAITCPECGQEYSPKCACGHELHAIPFPAPEYLAGRIAGLREAVEIITNEAEKTLGDIQPGDEAGRQTLKFAVSVLLTTAEDIKTRISELEKE